MPQSSEELRAIFMINGSDGILEAEKIITDAGGKIIGNGFVWLPEKITKETGQAAQYLFEEWDYAWIEPDIAVKMLRSLKVKLGFNEFVDVSNVEKIHSDIVSWLLNYLKAQNYKW